MNKFNVNYKQIWTNTNELSAYSIIAFIYFSLVVIINDVRWTGILAQASNVYLMIHLMISITYRCTMTHKLYFYVLYNSFTLFSLFLSFHSCNPIIRHIWLSCFFQERKKKFSTTYLLIEWGWQNDKCQFTKNSSIYHV